MARGSSHVVRNALRCVAGDVPDPELLGRFVRERDADAFRLLLLRHGPMVLALCRSLLRCEADAEDAFQATFLVLARRAEGIRKTASLPGWLHGVAYRTAIKARAAFARRRRHEPHAARPEAAAPDDPSWREVQEVLHEELSALSERYRVPLVLCYLQGKTLDETAAQLALARNTVKSRLERGREILRARLARRGLAPAAVLLAGVWPGATIALPPHLLESATRSAAHPPASAEVVALTEGVLSAMRITKLRLATAVLAVLAAVGLTLGGLAHADRPTPPPSPDKQDVPPAGAVAVAPAPRAAPAKVFDELTIAVRPWALTSDESPATIKIQSDGTCWYEIVEGSGNNVPAWVREKRKIKQTKHTLSPAQLRNLGALLEGTDWLTIADSVNVRLLSDTEYTLSLNRRGRETVITSTVGSEPYQALMTFVQGVSVQEYLVYRLEWEPAATAHARQELDTRVRAELGEQVAAPLRIGGTTYGIGERPWQQEIDYTRFAPWATRLVRKPFDRPGDDVATAIRLVGLLKLESEREYLAGLANDRDGRVRTAVAGALGRLGGEKSVAALRTMVRSTTDAPWELIKLGPIAVPAVAEVIGEGADPEQGEQLVRAYLDHWKEVPQPIDARILAAVRAGVATPKVKAHGTGYYDQFLKQAAEADREKKQ